MIKLGFKKLAVCFAAVLVCASFTACGVNDKQTNAAAEKFEVTVTDSSNHITTLTKKPERIVSLAPSTSEIVAALGAEAKLVGITEYCSFPEEIQDSAKVGGTSTPNLEKIIELKPDLVLASTHVPKEIVTKLRDLKIPTVFLNENDNFGGTYLAITEIANLIGEKEKGEKLVNDMKAKKDAIVSAVDKELEGKERPTIYFTNSFGENGDYAAGGDTFVSEILELAGGKNIAKDVKGWVYSKEKLVEKNPEIIIVPSGMDLKKQLSETPVYKDLDAVKNGKVYEVNGDKISRQGPRVVEALEEVAKAINPDLTYESK